MAVWQGARFRGASFLGKSALATIGFSVVPRRALGRMEYVPPSDKVKYRFHGCRAICRRFPDEVAIP